MTAMRAAEIHALVNWSAVLVGLGLDPAYVRLKKAGPCPACNGTDRYTFDDRNGRGDFICRGCGAGDGFTLLQRVFGWDFREARRRVLEAAGIKAGGDTSVIAARGASYAATAPQAAPAQPTSRIRALMTSSCVLGDCPDAIAYLESRGLWPVADGGMLKAHVGAEYFDDGRSIGKFPAIVAPVTDVHGELVTAHVTYLKDGHKLGNYEPRKLLSKTTGRIGCAVRLMPSGEVLGIAEGLETALSAASLEGVPVWAALNAALLAKFDPPATVSTLRIYADRDEAGLAAAATLMQRLQGRVRFELRTPTAPHKDFNDQLCSGAQRAGGLRV